MARALFILILVAVGLGTWQVSQRAEGAYHSPGEPGGFFLGNYSFLAELNLALDVCEHDQYIWGAGNPPPHNIKLTVTGFKTDLRISGPAPWVTVEGPYPGDDVEFVATGTGEVAGFSNIPVRFEGSIDRHSETVQGTYRFGVEGAGNPGSLPPCDDDDDPNSLPEAHAAYYQVKGKATPTPTVTPTPLDCPLGVPGGSCPGMPTATPGQQETVAQFLQLFNTALQTGDENFLLDRLNPHVIETYGEANCAATVAAMVDSTSSFTIKSISGPEPWTWNAPGVSILIDHVYTVSVQRVIEGESSMQDIHLAVVEDHLTWFRTCADTPLATPTLDVCAIAGGSSCTPTDTPTPQMVPPTWTPTNTPTPPVVPPTWTPTARGGDGDCDNNGTSNALDALYVLQYSAGLIPNPGVCGDTNQDGIINAIDCSLILQYVAGFVQRLPWSQ